MPQVSSRYSVSVIVLMNLLRARSVLLHSFFHFGRNTCLWALSWVFDLVDFRFFNYPGSNDDVI